MNEQAGSLPETPRALFSQEAFSPKTDSIGGTKIGTDVGTSSGADNGNGRAQSLPVDNSPDRNEFVNFLYDMSRRYDSHKYSFTNQLTSWFQSEEPEASKNPTISWRSIQRAEADPALSAQDRNWIGIVKRNYDTFQFLNRTEGDFFDGTKINSNRIEAIRDLQPNSERGEYIKAEYGNARIKTLGFRGSTNEGSARLFSAVVDEFDNQVKPKVEKLLDELRVEPAPQLLKLANEGNADAQYKVADLYLDGVEMYTVNGELSRLDLEQLEKALPFLNAAARGGNKDALYVLAEKIGDNSVSPARNAYEAVLKFFEKEASGGDAVSKEIYEAIKGGRRNEVAAELYKRAADQGSVPAMEMLGQTVKGITRFGKNLGRPLSEEAQQRYVKALQGYADKGDVTATRIMGELHELGTGVPVDGKKAEEYYRKAANAGDKEAQLHMGIINWEGTIVPKNLDESAKWFKTASDVVDWQLTQVLVNNMGRATHAETWHDVRREVNKLDEPVKSKILQQISDNRQSYDKAMIRFAYKAAGK